MLNGAVSAISALLAVTIGFSGGVCRTERTERSLTLAQESVQIVEERFEALPGQAEHSRREYRLGNGDLVVMGQAAAIAPGEAASRVAAFTVPAEGAVVHWYDAEASAWQSGPLEDGTVRSSCISVTSDAGGELLIYTPKVYIDLGAGTVQYLPELDGWLDVCQTGAGFRLSLRIPATPAGSTADYLYAVSAERLMDWDDPQTELDWGAYEALDKTGKWRYDGYYHVSPATYSPSGENCYYRQPSAYLCRNLTRLAPVSRAAADLSTAMLDVLTLQQNDYGFVPTLPQSGWLAEDYGIPGGFFDTRFNTDLTDVYYQFLSRQPCAEFEAAMERYFDFFTAYAAAYHQTTESGGWLIPDYWYPESDAQVHTSLNHQLAEILALYRYADLLQWPELETTADRMLLGIEDVGEDWIEEDGNLKYAIYPDGSFGGTEYLYLTYNDLLELQKLLDARGERSDMLDRLAASKLAWMQAGGVTGYNGWVQELDEAAQPSEEEFQSGEEQTPRQDH